MVGGGVGVGGVGGAGSGGCGAGGVGGSGAGDSGLGQTPLLALAGAGDETNCEPMLTVAVSVSPRSSVIVSRSTTVPLVGVTTVATAVFAPTMPGAGVGALTTSQV